MAEKPPFIVAESCRVNASRMVAVNLEGERCAVLH